MVLGTRVVEENVISEKYRPPVNGTIYQRFTVTGRERAGQLRERITNDENRILVQEERNEDRVTSVVEKNTTGLTEPVTGTASVFLNSLSVADYENNRPNSSSLSVYEPRSGWYEGDETYRLTDTSGTIRANAESHEVKSANVSWTITTPAGSYAEYALTRLTSEDPSTRRITFDFTPDDTDLKRPTWVNETESV